MSRTTIDLDDELVAEIMRRYGLTTKCEAVDLALRRLAGPRLSPEFVLGLEASAGRAISTRCGRRRSTRSVCGSSSRAGAGAVLVHRDRDFDLLGAVMPDLRLRSRL